MFIVSMILLIFGRKFRKFLINFLEGPRKISYDRFGCLHRYISHMYMPSMIVKIINWLGITRIGGLEQSGGKVFGEIENSRFLS